MNQRLVFFKNNVLPLILGQLGVAAVQGFQLLIVARTLGPHEFGKVAGILAITAACVPFSGLGTANMMVMQLARGQSSSSLLYGNALTAGLMSGLGLTALVLAGFYFWDGDSNFLVICLLFCISELIFSKFVDISQHVFFGMDRHAIASKFLLIQSGFRFAGALLMMQLSMQTAFHWAVAHIVGGGLAATLIIAYTLKTTGRLKFNFKKMCSDIRHGVFFSLGFASRGIYIDIDKAILPRFEAVSINGAYTAAFRLVYMATTPLTAGLLALQARMYRAGGAQGITETARIARRAMVAGVIYGAVVGVVIYAAAPLLPLIIGPKYALSVDIMRTLAFLPIPLFAQSAMSDALAAANHQRARSVVQIVVAGLAVVLNFALIQAYSWKGAVITAYVCQFVLLCFMAAIVHQKTR